jgi:Tat protein secretion system quality control protein TatD with DNase activity
MTNDLYSEILDAHVHVGQFKERYFPPEFIVKEMRSLKVKKWIVSSTSSCDEHYDFGKVKDEINCLLHIAPNEAFPLLWIRPDMIEKSPDLSKYEHKHYGFKIHGYIQNWDPIGEPIKKVFSIAKERSLPVLIHTGGKKECDAESYMSICEMFPTVKVVLAHGRPIEQAEKMLEKCPNCRVDTAFMPIENILHLISKGYTDRILFGSDHPIGVFYDKKKSEDIYKDIIFNLKSNIEHDDLMRICSGNIKKVFFHSQKS